MTSLVLPDTDASALNLGKGYIYDIDLPEAFPTMYGLWDFDPARVTDNGSGYASEVAPRIGTLTLKNSNDANRPFIAGRTLQFRGASALGFYTSGGSLNSFTTSSHTQLVVMKPVSAAASPQHILSNSSSTSGRNIFYRQSAELRAAIDNKSTFPLMGTTMADDEWTWVIKDWNASTHTLSLRVGQGPWVQSVDPGPTYASITGATWFLGGTALTTTSLSADVAGVFASPISLRAEAEVTAKTAMLDSLAMMLRRKATT